MIVLIVGILLLIVSIIDFEFKAVPSILLTGLIFVVAFMYPANLWFGIMGFIMAFLLYEGTFFSGIGDVKVMTMISFMITSMSWMFWCIFLILIYGVAWKMFWNWRFRLKKKKLPNEFPFIPVFLFVYFILVISGGII